MNKNWLYGGLRVSQPDPWKFSRNFDAVFYANKQWTDDGLTIFENINWFAGTRLWNLLERRLLRGPQLRVRRRPRHARRAADRQTGAGISTASTSTPTRASAGASGLFLFGNHDAVGRAGRRNIGINVRLQPSGRLQANVSANYTRADDSAQWIENTDADGDGEEDHVYGRLRRNASTSRAAARTRSRAT